MGTVRYAVANGQILAEKRSGNYRFYRSDALGSTVSLYDSNQTKTDSFTYWPYGETRTSSGSTGTKYKFVGTLGCRTRWDGGIYMRARVEQPKDGRWMTVDPFWPESQAYAYAANSPSTNVDPAGLCWEFKRCLPSLGGIFTGKTCTWKKYCIVTCWLRRIGPCLPILAPHPGLETWERVFIHHRDSDTIKSILCAPGGLAGCMVACSRAGIPALWCTALCALGAILCGIGLGRCKKGNGDVCFEVHTHCDDLPEIKCCEGYGLP